MSNSNKKTSKRVASIASELLKGQKVSKKVKIVAGSALSQSKGKKSKK